MHSPYACYVLTPQGLALARDLAKSLDIVLFAHTQLRAANAHVFHSLPLILGQTFDQYQGHIVMGAVGMTVRCIAPLILHKSVDPAVIACDEGGRFAIAVLSGHVGGGNVLARRVADILGAQAVVTTATDAQGLPSIDMTAREAACSILDWDSVKTVNGSVLRGEKVLLHDPLRVLDFAGQESLFTPCTAEEALQSSTPAVFVHWRAAPPRAGLLRIAVPALYVGLGCRRGVGTADILEAIRATVRQYGLEIAAVAGLATVTAKEDEVGLQEAARMLNLPLSLYSPEELAEAPVLSPSAMAAQLFGVEGISVSEGAALLAAGNDEASLLVPKERHNERVTVAVALHERFVC